MRRRPHLLQADIARACKVRTPSVADWINGKTKSLRPEPARLGAALFGCDQNWLASGTGTPNWVDEPPQPLNQAQPPTLADALPVVLDAMAAAPDKGKLRTALHAVLDDDVPAYRQRLAELLAAPVSPRPVHTPAQPAPPAPNLAAQRSKYRLPGLTPVADDPAQTPPAAVPRES